MKHQKALPITIFFALFAVACDEREAPPSNVGDRDVYFDGVEVEATLAENPSVMFFADLRDENIVHFDQSEEAIDFSHFIVQCPSMPGPMMMDEYLDSFEEEFYTQERWSIRSTVDPDGEELRSVPVPPPGCYYYCPPGATTAYDCVLVCPDV
jgi:hypothetical protein